MLVSRWNKPALLQNMAKSYVTAMYIYSFSMCLERLTKLARANAIYTNHTIVLSYMATRCSFHSQEQANTKAHSTDVQQKSRKATS